MNLKDKLFDTNLKKCIFIFVIIFLVIAVTGVFAINYLHTVVTDSNVYTKTITVENKMHNNNYLIVDTNNTTYCIIDHSDRYNQMIFDTLAVNGTYEVVVKNPDLIDINHIPHIIQVHNDTRTS